MHRPLEGIRILEWGTFYAAPGGSAILTDLGAEVIKIEQRGTGDPFRHGNKSDLEVAGDSNVLFVGANRGKKSITINMSLPEGKQIVYNLAGKCDVFVTNLRRSTIARMGMDYATMAKINPMIIYAGVTAYGTRGPDADHGGFDPQGQARSGMMFSGNPDEPKMKLPGIVDHSTAVMVSYQIVIALLMRERFGIGQEVDVSLLGTASYLQYLDNLHMLLTGEDTAHHQREAIRALVNHYRCQDGQWLMLRIFEDHWAAVCEIIGHAELIADPRCETREARAAHRPELIAIFKKAFAARPRDEWLRMLLEKHLVACAVNTPRQSFEDPQMVENEYVVHSPRPGKVTVRIPGFPIHFSRAKVERHSIAPRLGQHTDVVLKELGGYSDVEIAHFKEAKVV